MKTGNRPILAIIGLVTGLLGLVAWLFPICGVPLAIAAVVTGFLSRHSSRRGMAIAGMTTGAIALVLALGMAGLDRYMNSTGQSLGAPPSEDVKEQVIAAEKASYAQSHPDLVVTDVELEFRENGRLLPADRSNGVTMLRCYAAWISYTTADGSCQGGDLHYGLLALVGGRWNYDMYDQIGFDTWAEHDCGDFPLRVGGRCPTPSPTP